MVDSATLEIAIALALGLGSFVGSAGIGLIGAVSAHRRRLGTRSRGVALGSGIVSVGLAGLAVVTVPTTLPMVVMGTFGAIAMGAGAGLLGSEATQLTRRALH